MQKIFLTLFGLLLSSLFFVAEAQLNENFNDSDFINNPVWVGNTGDWLIDSVHQLQSNNTVANSTFYLSTANTLATMAQWDMFIQLSLNTSSLNYVDIYLTASDSNITNPVTGYFVRLGGTADEISLFRKDANGDTTRLIDGINGILNSSTNKINLRVTRNAANQWNLLRDISGTGANYFSEGFATDATYTTSAYFGILIKQSTASFFKKHFFDDIIIQPLVPDTTPPALQSVSIVSATALDVLFTEPVDAATAQLVTTYSVNNGIGNPSNAVRDAANQALIHLTFASPFPNNTTNTITISNINDVSGNTLVSATTIFAYVVDITPPSIQSVAAISINTADVLFSEPVDATTAQVVTNYSVDNGVGNALSAVRDGANTSLVHLSFAANFPNTIANTLTVNNVTDIAGNAIVNGTGTFSFYTPQRFDVVIDEIMADPNPVVALPDAEYIEVKNVSGKSINLAGWHLTSTSSVSGAFPVYTLPADSFLIVTTTTSAPLFTGYGRVVGLPSFPALSNGGTTLSLVSEAGITIHSVSYNPTWFQNDVKSNGGWSLEMIDTKNPCTGAANWKASIDARGGSPGMQNSIDGSNPDTEGPAIIRAAVIDSVTLLLTFSEAINSSAAAVAGNYKIDNNINTPVSAIAIAPDFTKVQLKLATALSAGVIYTITVDNISDCSGNVIVANTARFGLPSAIDSFDIVINEVLFNPTPVSTDYVEIYNRSNKILDLKNLYIANRSVTTNLLGVPVQVTTDNIILFPGEYYVLSASGVLVKQNYYAKNPDNFIDLSLPSYSDDEGVIVLLNNLGNRVDELHYSDKWHFALLDNTEGISLERVDYNKPTQDAQNWHSAAATVGFGTPSYQNSQYRADITGSGEVSVTPKVFSPDNDGFNDFATISYHIADLGYVGTITIFDAAGRPVRLLAQNATLAQTGLIRWDGLNDKLVKVPVGTYVIYTEMFNLSGKKKSFKNVVVVASKF